MMGQVGYIGVEDDGVCAGIVRGNWEGVEEVKQVKEDKPAPKTKAPPSKRPAIQTRGKKMCRMHCESDDSSDRAPPPQ